MTKAATTFDFNIIPVPPQVKDLHPRDFAEVKFHVVNTGYPVQAEAVVVPLDGPADVEGRPLQPEEWSNWLTLVEAPQYDYASNSIRTFTVQIRIGEIANPGSYKFLLLLTGLDDPDHVSMMSQPVSFNVVIPPVNARPILIGGIALLALFLIAGVILILSSPKTVGLYRKLTPPNSVVTAGQPAIYTLELLNKPPTPAEGVVLDYEYPSSVAGVWAKVDMEGPVIPHCATANKHLRCAFNEITTNQKVLIYISILPDPKDSEPPIPVKLGAINLYWNEKGNPISDQLTIVAPDIEKANPISVAVIPAADAATVDMPVKITLQALFANPVNKADEFIFTLPDGMRFQQNPPDRCRYDDPSNYFLLTCKPDDSNSFELQVIPLQESNGSNFSLQVNEQGGADSPATVTEQDLLPAKNNLLILNGRDEWVQLGFIGMTEKTAEMTKTQTPTLSPSQTVTGSPPTNTTPRLVPSLVTHTTPSPAATASPEITVSPSMTTSQAYPYAMPREFTVSMWVNPLSTEDGQAFLGAHLHSPDNMKVNNLFLVGYYNDAIEINVMDDFHSLCAQKPADPFHLMIVVDRSSDGNPVVRGYINGIAQAWKDESGNCQVDTKSWNFKTAIADLEGQPFNWVVGQDWDPNGSGIIQSDYFHGAISDLRLWGTALIKNEQDEKDEIGSGMYLLPPCLNGNDEKCNAQGLLGWWPLAPTTALETGQVVDCRLAKTGQVVSAAASSTLPGACILPDFGPNPTPYDGVRNGGSWEKSAARFGNALAFDGKSAVKIPDVDFSNFKPVSGTVPITISAWVSVDSLSHHKQVIFADIFGPSTDMKAAGMMIDADSHVEAFYGQVNSDKSLEIIGHEKDERSIQPGSWVHYAMVLTYDPSTGKLADIQKPVKLFRNAENVKGMTDTTDSVDLKGVKINGNGFYLGGFDNADIQSDACLVGRMDEVRIWNRALIEKDSRHSLELDRWRRWPGIRFNEVQYWSFDDARSLGTEMGNPAWVLSDLTIDTGQ